MSQAPNREVESESSDEHVSDSRLGELTAAFGVGEGFESYCDRWDYRTGEQYMFENFLDHAGSLLDIGCGTGRTSFLLAPQFERVDAFDIVAEMIAFAQVRRSEVESSANFFVADASSIPVADESYDNVIFAYNGIEGLPTASLRERALKEVHRVLRPGGRFVFSTKSYFNLQYFKAYHLKHLVRRIGLPLFRDCASLGPGEVYVWEGKEPLQYHTSNPFRVKRTLRQVGFDLLHFNSEVRMGMGQHKPSFRSHFDRWDHFYACEKAGR